jgi:hypothetical protein
MPVFGRTKKESYTAPTPAKEGEATAKEAFNIQYDSEYFVNGRRDVESTNYRDEWKPILEAIESTTGKKFSNPGNWLYLPTPDDRNTSITNPYREFDSENPEQSLQAATPLYNRQELYDTSSNKVFDYIAENQDLFANVSEVKNLNGTVISERVKEKVLKRLANMQNLNKKERSTGNYLSGFGGAMAATITDVPNFIVTGATLWATKGRSLSLAKTMTLEAFANAGAEVIAQEEVMDWYASLDLPYTMEEFYYNVAAAAAGGAILSGGMKVAFKIPGLTAAQWRKGKKAIDKANARKAGLEYKEDIILNAAEKEGKIEDKFENETPYKEEADPSGQKNIDDQNQAAAALIQEDGSKLPTTPINEVKDYDVLDSNKSSAVLVDPDNIEIDAAKFQFKEGGDEFGVTERLQDVTEWDDVKSNVAIIYETADGKQFIVDGHQRVALAKKIKAQQTEQTVWEDLPNDLDARIAVLQEAFNKRLPVQAVQLQQAIDAGEIKSINDLLEFTAYYNKYYKGKKTKGSEFKAPKILAYIRKETDGVSIEAVRAEAAAKNIAEGSGTLVDAAKIFRDDPGLVKLLPPRSKLVEQAKGLANLSDEAFMAAINGVVTPEYGAIVGRYIDNPADQLATMKLLQKLNPQNATQVESIVAQAKAIGFQKAEQTGLFGDEVIAENAFLSRAKILDTTLKFLREKKSIFKTLVDDASVIEEFGNSLNKLTNAQKDKVYGQAIETIKQNANNVGDIADNLTALAKEFESKGSKNIGDFAKRFAENLEQGIKSGNFKRIDASGGRRYDTNTKKADTGNTIRKEYDDPDLIKKYDKPVILTQIKQELSDLEANVDQIAKDNGLQDSFGFEDGSTGTLKDANLDVIKKESLREQKMIDELKDC